MAEEKHVRGTSLEPGGFWDQFEAALSKDVFLLDWPPDPSPWAQEREAGDWDEQEHPRQPAGGEQGGEFAPKGEGAIQIGRAPKSERVFRGLSKRVRVQPTRQEIGALGEQLAVAWLKQQGYRDARPLNYERNNIAIDLIQDHEGIEVKAGLVSNSASAQHWRLTIGEPGKKEQTWLRTASDSVKARWHARKQGLIAQRKQRMLKELSRKLGRPVKARTLTFIVDPDRKTADVFSFAGWHNRIGWNSEQARSGYVGTIRYD